MMNRKVLICSHAYPPDSGGIAAFARDLKQLFQEMRWNVSIHKTKNQTIKNKIDVFKNIIVNLIQYIKKVKTENPDVIISTRIQPYGIMSVISKLFLKPKVILQVHGTEIEGRFKKGWRKILFKFIFNNSDQVWANSKNTIERLIEFGVKSNKIKLVYPFLTSDITNITFSEPTKKDSSKLRIFTAGSLYPRKGIDLVLNALSSIKNLSWEYIIAGKAIRGYEGYYERMALDLNVSNKVKFLGQIEREDVWWNMEKADVFVLTSREIPNDIESFGIVYIEAQYFGTPCIGTKTGGIPEAIGKGGYLIENENIGQLEKHLKNFMTKKDLSKISYLGKKRVRNNFLSRNRSRDVINYLKEIDIYQA